MLRSAVIFVAFMVGGALSGYAGSTSNNVGGTGYGYSGSFSGNGAPPNFPGFPTFDFSGFLNTYLDSFRKYHQEFVNNPGSGAYSYSVSYNSPDSHSQAQSSLTLGGDGLQDNIFRAQSGYGVPGGFPAASGFSGGYGGGYGSSNGNSGGFGGSFSSGGPGINSYGAPLGGSGGFANPFGGAASSASIGPGGVHQTAQVFPENPAQPNINTRFGAPSNGGHYSVFTSSSSHTSNVNGRPQTFQQAQTTVNDNGKITTYTAKNP